MESDVHADVPCTPDSGTQVADSNAVAHLVDVLAAGLQRSGNEADTVDDVIKLNLELGAGIAGLDGADLVADLGDGVAQVHGNLVILHSITQEGGIGKAGRLCGNFVSVLLHL